MISGDLDSISGAEIVVGVPSFSGARTGGPVLESVAAGLARYRPGKSRVVVVVEDGSRDGTPDVVRRAVGDASPVLILSSGSQGTGPPGAGRPGLAGDAAALRAILRVVERAGARACALVDGGVAAVRPEWVERLLEPVLEHGMDLVAPLYARHKYGGMLTGALLYPLTRALYGVRVRQPVGGHFGVSGAFAARLLRAGFWGVGGGAAPGSLDMWMVTTAAADGRPICQARLGPVARSSRHATGELGESFVAAVGTAFALMEEYRPAWWSVVATGEVPTYGPPLDVGLEPVSVNLDRMVSTFRQGVADLMAEWRRALDPATCDALAALGENAAADFAFPPELWARVVYDSAVAYHQRRVPRRHLLRTMVPLYLGRAAAFVLGTEGCEAAGLETEAEAVCAAFEAMKPHLLDRWDDPRS